MKALEESVPGYQIRDMVKEVDIDENGTVEFDEFVEVRCVCVCVIVCDRVNIHLFVINYVFVIFIHIMCSLHAVRFK